MTALSRRAFVAGAGTVAAAAPTRGAAASARPGNEVPLLRSYVAGATRQVVQSALSELEPGRPLRLVREPGNDYDARAVAVWTDAGTRLGYLPRVDNKAPASLMDAGLRPRARVARVRADRPRPHIEVEIRLPLA